MGWKIKTPDGGIPLALSVGLTNYSAAYCVGLLCARRLLTKYGLADKFEGTEEVTAEFEDCFVLNTEDEEGVSAFHANLDVGLKRTTLGSKIFSAMKGAFDGGLEIPHSEKKFYGYDPDEKVTLVVTPLESGLQKKLCENALVGKSQFPDPLSHTLTVLRR